MIVVKLFPPNNKISIFKEKNHYFSLGRVIELPTSLFYMTLEMELSSKIIAINSCLL